ncbi:glucuronate isomerase [Protaetiibacter intestinalis]|uniref:Uronate isomerase n=1 Tax=Protaetiibacter intestinalis TaxID=2419774 RepID=A0A387B475_9MICO|nr:glucuronate isomerase [Protaetiibacter intestinalis]AYF98392.1 glucuronate isomerase [Protaetiibacter intestinalis]
MSEHPRWTLDPDRALPAEPTRRAIAREIHGRTADLPIVSMHGHVDAGTLARDEAFGDAAELFVIPDHYLLRMLVSQGVPHHELGIPPRDGGPVQHDRREIWRRFCEHWRAFRGTPTRYWLEHELVEVFGVSRAPSAATADLLYDELLETLARPEFRIRALFERFGIEVLGTTDSATSALADHATLRRDGWGDRVVPTFRPDVLFHPDGAGWRAAIDELSAASGVEVGDQAGFLEALRERRRYFVAAGARATDHGHRTPDTTPLPAEEAQRLFAAALRGPLGVREAEAYAAHMLFESARMSLEDGLVMQLHPGVVRDHSAQVAGRYGSDLGFDIPRGVEFTRALRPLLDAVGHDPRFRLILFTVDETAYSRELAPLAGAYPSVLLGAPWWFLDAPGGLARFRELTTETAGFYNTSGFVDDTRAFASIPARHDLARRIDAGYLAKLVAEHRLGLDEAIETAIDLTVTLPRAAYARPGDGG